MTDEGRGKGMETCFPWAARRPTFKWFVGDVLLNTSLLLFFLFFANQWPHCILGGQLLFELLTTTSWRLELFIATT